ncbi:helix-turn-helix transcriptional regulator [Demequina capsici]|uniref:Helix-turn-helix transcriptional regulator n=1 Tax=Demequina capsici TaxID=3075620 RepID=A0AA96FDE2_9MICO|nr:helix-turn-helix transcriptional regulator [Demequina sp. PMTSA13]WNM27512.1 helix-turn-helix transcriptional regulator [Demequina sp. PMTSA13]
MIPVFDKGDRFRKARESKGLNQFELAEKIGIGRASVQNYETGRIDPKPLIVKQWALVTGVPVYWLQWGMDEAPTGPVPDRGFGELVFTAARPEGFEPPTF